MRTILVVEDDAAIALGLEEDLTIEGYSVEIARDGETALRCAREGKFNLILLDVMLPRKDGFQVCRELRRAGIQTPIILLTARTQEVEKVLGLQIGADDYVTKPFSPLELRARIQALLRRTEGQSEPQTDIYRFGNVEVNFARCELRQRGKLVDMTPVEFKLLGAFIASRGRVLSRQQLLDKVWSDTTCGDRVVDTHVSNLRKKIEENSAEPEHLISVRGMGYRFDG